MAGPSPGRADLERTGYHRALAASHLGSAAAQATGVSVGKTFEGGRRQFCGSVAAALSASPLWAATPSTPLALLTILDGEAQALLGARAVTATEGLRLPEGTIVETTPATTLLRLEWPDGSVLDLGPGTRVMLQPGGLARRDGIAPVCYLLSGWAKQRSGPTSQHRGHVSPQLDALPAQGVLVAHVEPGTTWLFAETGSAAVVERAGTTGRHALPAGSSYLRKGAAGGEVLPRPDPAQLKTVPRGFRDTIGPRAARFEGKVVVSVDRPTPTYEALAPWLTAEPALRREFPRRFAALARDVAFRSGLAAHLPSHPEWDTVLYPQLFVKPASTPYGVRR